MDAENLKAESLEGRTVFNADQAELITGAWDASLYLMNDLLKTLEDVDSEGTANPEAELFRRYSGRAYEQGRGAFFQYTGANR